MQANIALHAAPDRSPDHRPNANHPDQASTSPHPHLDGPGISQHVPAHDVDPDTDSPHHDSVGPQQQHALRLQRDNLPQCTVTTPADSVDGRKTHKPSLSVDTHHRKIPSSDSAASSCPAALSPSIGSPTSACLVDLTPLPSPIGPASSPGPWSKMAAQPFLHDPVARPPSNSVLMTKNGETITSAMQKRKAYHGLMTPSGDPREALSAVKQENLAAHARNRNVSEYVPEALHPRRPRHITVSESRDPSERTSSGTLFMKREECLAEKRGISSPQFQPPTPPPSNTGGDSDSDSSVAKHEVRSRTASTCIDTIFEADDLLHKRRRRWRRVRELGEGTFSKVILATSQAVTDGDELPAVSAPLDEAPLDPKRLVAVKVIEHGPAGGASEERMDISLKRELDILKSIHHPSLVHLKAFSIEMTRALLVLSYCPGGDMFEVASQRQHLLVPSLIRRIFAELVSATNYLHDHLIVHRDIKLENVLLNLPCATLPSVSDWQSYPYSVVTLTDMGLSRRIDPVDPKLHTRCGSEDYASPELLMGQAYDGRQTDAWALGVLLYALMEGRLPFDPMPGASEAQKVRSRTVHRIARCDWAWVRFADDEGEPGDFGELEGARTVVEGLLKRATRRWDLGRVAEEDWVKRGVVVEGELKAHEEVD
ncbi:MAG: hypothetical protein M1817_004546 [Caeruleum heppii]|nr:MAG: hypothetical protein M1817_004546 [Caeruleum heppii]